MQFLLATASEICAELGARLRLQRLQQGLSQQELALRSGLGLASVKRAEQGGALALDNWLKLVLTLGLAHELQEVFVPRAQSIAELQRIHAKPRQRAPRQVRKEQKT